MKSLSAVLPIIRSHHERWDGAAIRTGSAASKSPLLARILQLVDIYNTLTTRRPYKPALSHERAMAILRKNPTGGGARSRQLDPALRRGGKIVSRRRDHGDRALSDAALAREHEPPRQVGIVLEINYRTMTSEIRIALSAFLVYSCVAAQPSQAPLPEAQRTQWFQDAKFGMFIHWGVYSVIGRHEGRATGSRSPKPNTTNSPASSTP